MAEIFEDFWLGFSLIAKVGGFTFVSIFIVGKVLEHVFYDGFIISLVLL